MVKQKGKSTETNSQGTTGVFATNFVALHFESFRHISKFL